MARDDDEDRPKRRRRPERDDEDDDDRPARRSKKKKPKSNPVLYIIGLVIAAAVAVTAVVVVVNLARDREEAAKNQGGTTRGGERTGEGGTGPGNPTAIGAPAPMVEQLIAVSTPVFSRAGGGPTLSFDYEVFGDKPLPPRLILVIRYADGFKTQDLDLNGLRPGERRRATIELEKSVQVKFGQIELWVGIPGGGALVGTSQRVSNVERVAAP